MAIKYVDLSGSAGDGSGDSFANRAASPQTITGLSAGDSIRLMGSPSPTSLAQNATFTNKSRTVTLTTAVTTNITLCENAWTASTNVTCSTNSTVEKQGTLCVSHAIAAGFTTGKVAYFATGTLDLSTYQQVSFWFRSDIAVAANVFRLRLSTDTTGDTATHEFVINRAVPAGQWVPLTFDNGANMNAAIASVALIADSDPGTATILMDNILACKDDASADSLTLQSLIGKNTAGETWWALKSINGTTLTIDMNVNSDSATGRGYSGVTETVNIWKRETIKTPAVATSTTDVMTIPAHGTAGNVIAISGGWNTTDMSTQTLEASLFDGLDGFGVGLNNTRNYVTFDKVGFVRYNTGMYFSAGTPATLISALCLSHCTSLNLRIAPSTGNMVTVSMVSGCVGSLTNGVTYSSGSEITFGTIYANSNTTDGLSFQVGNDERVQFTGNIVGNNNGGWGLNGGSSTGANIIMSPTASSTFNDNVSGGLRLGAANPCTLFTLTACSNTGYGVDQINSITSGHRIYGYTSNANSSGSIRLPSNGGVIGGDLFYLYRATMGESTPISTVSAGSNAKIHSYQENNGYNTHKIYTDGGTIASDASVTHGNSSLSWKLSPTSTNRDSFYPLVLPIAQVLCASSQQVTFKAWIRRDSTSITNTVTLLGGRVAGIPNDVIATGAAGANTWEQITLQATPTETAVLEFQYSCYGGTTLNAWISDLEITQT